MMKKYFKNNKIFATVITWISLWVCLLMLSVMPAVAKWLKDTSYVTIQDIYLPFAISLILSIALTQIFYFRFKINRLAGLCGGILSILILGSDFESRLKHAWSTLHAITPLADLKTDEGPVYSIIFIVIIILILRFVTSLIEKYSTQKKWNITVLSRAIMLTISVAFVLQMYSFVRVIITEWPQFFYTPPVISANLTDTTTKPDIYYIVLDSYTNQKVLKSQFSFDNSDFTSYLSDNGFYVKPDAYSNYPYTASSVSSTLNGDYHSDVIEKYSKSTLQTEEPYYDSIRRSPIIKKLKSKGYDYYHLGTWYEASNYAPLADYYYQLDGQLTIFGHRFTLGVFPKINLTQSVFWRFVEHGVNIGKYRLLTYDGQSEVGANTSKLATLHDIASKPAGGKFVFTHLLVPHNTYYYNPDGSLSTNAGSDNQGKLIKQKYTDQIQYINTQMKSIIADILEATNNQAVIILQSDEGPYPMILNTQDIYFKSVADEVASGDMLKWSDDDLKMKYGILAAYHIPKTDPVNLETNTNSANIFRLVFNTYFNTNLSYLPDCHYAFPTGRKNSFVFENITARLTGTNNPLCPINSNFLKVE